MEFRIATAKLIGMSPYSQSRFSGDKKEKNESDDTFDLRNWRSRAYADEKGFVYINPMAIKFSLMDSAKDAGEKMKGKGMKMWGQRFVQGIHVAPAGKEPHIYILPKIKVDEVDCFTGFMSSTGDRGKGKRVIRRYPLINEWSCNVDFRLMDHEIPEDKFLEFLVRAGLLIGIGRFRPQVGGMNGMFSVAGLTWNKVTI